jgi:hypothetical protein
MFRIAASLLLLGTACATTASTPPQSPASVRVGKTLAGLTAGTPQRCLTRDRFNETRSAEGVILFVAGKNRVWRNDVVGDGCRGLDRGDVIVFQTLNGQHCSGDIVQTRTAIGGNLSGSCSLGRFVPYRK